MNRLKQVLRETAELFEEYMPVEQKKLKAAAADDIAAVEECLAKEQALLLKLRGLEKKREALLSEYGFDGMSLREIIDGTQGEDREELSALFDRLSVSVRRFSSTNTEALKIVDLRLHNLEKLTNAAPAAEDYGRHTDGAAYHMTDRKV